MIEKKFNPSQKFLAKKKRIEDAINLEKPDQIPVVPLNYTFYPTRMKGISNRDAMYYLDKTFQVWKESVMEYDWDAAPFTTSFLAARPLDILGIKTMKWPGGGLPEDQPFQWVEGEYMKQGEYDEALADPAGFALNKLWPRIMTFDELPAGIKRIPGTLLLMLSNAYALPGFLGQMFSSSGTKLTQRAGDLAEFSCQIEEAHNQYVKEVNECGYPTMVSGMAITAFDAVSDALRGMKGSMLDMYKTPDKLLALVEKFTPFTISGAVNTARQAGVNGVFIALHRGAAGFMSDKQFEKFYWPSMKALILGIIDAGLTPMPFMEGDYTPRLDYLQDLPAKKILPHWDKVDRKKVKEKLGDRMCFWGNVPASLMCTGTPQQVKDNVKELIDLFGNNGGLIVDGVPGIPDEAKPENVRALLEAVHEPR